MCERKLHKKSYMLKPVKIRSTVEAAIENIGSYIATLQEGDVLPGERELAEKLQISRNITREALPHTGNN